MRSETEVLQGSEADVRPRLAWLRSQGLGILCGQATVLLLGIGSIVMASTEGGLTRARLDDVTAFFREPAVEHLWLYLLMPVLGLYAVNTTLATWDHVIKRWRQGQRALSVYASAFFHVGFLAALVAHGVGGFFGSEGQPVLIAGSWQDLGDGRSARVVALDEPRHPDGSLKQVHATLEVREDGEVRRAEVSFNGPLFHGPSDLMLLADWGIRGMSAQVSSAGRSCAAPDEGSCALGGMQVDVVQLREGGPGGPPSAWLRVRDGAGRREEFVIAAGQDHQVAFGPTVKLDGVVPEPAVLLRRRHAPGNPWALAATVFLGLGTVMMGRRWF